MPPWSRAVRRRTRSAVAATWCVRSGAARSPACGGLPARRPTSCGRRGRAPDMRIGIGARVGIVGGPATYARELVGALARIGGHDYVVFTDQPELFAAIDLDRVHVPLRATYHQVTWHHARLPGMLAAHGVALYPGTKTVLPWRLAMPGVVTVHDLAVYACPETFAWPQRLHFRLAVPGS